MEDKLTHNERLKLEALAQAIAYRGGFGTTDAQAICGDADVFLGWIGEEGAEFTSVDLYAAIKVAREMPNATADEIIDRIREMKAKEG